MKTVRHFLQREAHVFEADLLADDVKRHGRHLVVHAAQHPGQHRAVAHTGVKQPERWRVRVDVGQLHLDAPRRHPFLGAGVDEEQVFLAVVVKAEVAWRGIRLGQARAGSQTCGEAFCGT